jgi:6-phosphofructokinase 2
MKTIVIMSLNPAIDKSSSVAHVIAFGVATGAAAVMTPGTELCRREDAERLFEKMVSGS